jgi:hypothetical protein
VSRLLAATRLVETSAVRVGAARVDGLVDRPRWDSLTPRMSSGVASDEPASPRVAQMESFAERFEFAGGEISPGADGDAAQVERADANAAQTLDGDADGFHYAPDNMIHTLVNDDLEQKAIMRGTEHPEFAREDSFTVDHHAVPDALERRVGGAVEGEDVIFLFQFVARMHDAIRDVTVIGQEQQAFGRAIEPADGIDALRDLNQVKDHPAIALVFGGRNVAARFVEQDVSRCLRPHY